jgi:glycosyltransferase involved in cell wall biosynthesis
MREHMMRNGVVDPKVVPLFTEAGEVPSPPPGNRVILFVGRVVNYKGLEVAVEALAEVPDAYLWILGDGWEMPKVTAEVERLGIADRVRRIGWTAPQDLPTLYQKADVVVVPSRWPEPFGMVGIEAMAQGRAVIASDSGGMRDWLVPDETGWFFKPGSATELATRLRVALDDPGRLEEMGSTGRARVIERFSPEAFGREIGGVYGGATR